MATLTLRVDFIDTSDKTQPGRPTGYTVVGFECASMAVVSAQPGNRDRWVVHLAPPGARLQCVPTSFSDPEAALRFLQQWADEQTALAKERAKAS
jgi:hypothetical protein